MSANANISHREDYELTSATIGEHLDAIDDLVGGMSIADALRHVRLCRKHFETAEKAPADFVKASDRPAVGIGCTATRNLVAGTTQWKQVAEKVAADAGVSLDDAYLAAFKSKPAYRVDLTEPTEETPAAAEAV